MTITVAGTALTNVFNVQHQKSISELGQSGISVSSLSFDVIAPFIADTAALVTCDMIPGIDYYVNTRSKSGHVVHVECLDAAAFLDQEIKLTNQDINHVVESGKVLGDFVGGATIAAKIGTYCKNLIASVPWVPTDYGFPLDYVQGKTYQQILTDISEVCAGFYTVVSGNVLTLKYLNEMDAVNGRAHHTITYHSAVNVNGEFEYQAINVVASFGTGTIGGTEVTDFNTLTISNSLSEYVFPSHDATRTNPDTGQSEHYTQVDTTTTPDELNDIINVGHDGWTCDNAVLSTVYPLGDYVDFQTGEELIITDMSVRFVGNTILASLSGGIPSSGEISRRPRRQVELDNKLTIGKTYGNVTYNPYGQSYPEQAASQSGGS